MKGTIFVRLQGGLGNQMFQIAFGEYVSFAYGYDVVYTGFTENLMRIKQRSPHANIYPDLFKHLTLTYHSDRKPTRTVKVPFHFTNIKIEDGVEYVGYFQSELFWEERRNFIRYIFNMYYKPEFKHDGVTCSVHIRRGDYLQQQDFHPVLPVEYYQMATKGLDTVDKFLIFTDDKNIDFSEYIVGDYEVMDSADYTEMYLMSQCTAHIIANSSFSWWGAYLDANEGTVIAPSIWFGPSCKDDPKDIIPKDWLVI